MNGLQHVQSNPSNGTTSNVLTIKWGRRYGPEYVNRLFAGVCRNTHRNLRFLCFTDDRTGIRDEVEIWPLPQADSNALSQFANGRKQGLFRRGIGDLEGTCLYFDLDVLVVGSIDCLFDFEPGKFCVCPEWLTPMEVARDWLRGRDQGANTSVFRFEADTMHHVPDYARDHSDIVQRFSIEQQFLSHVMRGKLCWWPLKWIVSFKRRKPGYPLSLIRPPKLLEGSRVVVFNGPLKPCHAIHGTSSWSPRRACRPAAWVAEHWRE